MDSTQEDNYLQKITELVYDDNEIVTSTVLSKILNIKVDCAKVLLDKYVKNADVPDQTDVSWTYLIIGNNEDNSISILLSKNKEVNEKRKCLQNIISQHVYSVQRNLNIDLVALANLEPVTENSVKDKPLLGSVVSKNAIKRKLKVLSLISEKKSEIKEPIKQNISEVTNKAKKNGIESFCTKGPTQTNNFKPITNAKIKQKNVMANFFSKQTTKENTNGVAQKHQINADKDNENVSGDVEYISCNTIDNNAEEKRMEIDIESETKKEEADEIKKDENKDKQNISKQSKKSKKRRTENKSSQPSKKRKRIVETNDSDSDIFASSESEIEVVPDIHLSDDNYVEESKVEPNLSTKTRRMKQITEEFMDEEGYINTIQKYVMVSEDETDENKEQKPMNNITDKTTIEIGTIKNNDNKDVVPAFKKEMSPKKATKNNKGKAHKGSQNQPSIMNFFKKT